jgi:putative endonuclease
MHARSMTARAGERLARAALEARGYHILSTNWRARGDVRGELDIVATDGGELVFVEVKTRRSTAYGLPAEAVTPAKARQLLALAQAYVAGLPGSGDGAGAAEPAWRIDVVAIELRHTGGPHIEIITDAVYAE